MSDNHRKAPAPRVRHPILGGRFIFKLLLWGLGSLGVVVVAGVAAALIALAVAYPNLPEISSLTDYRPKQPMRVYSADNVLLGEFGEERRNFTPIQDIPKVLKEAVVATEDARFYEHRGIDYKGLLRALVASLRNYKSQGASTITMQVARNFYLPSEKFYVRKLYEMLLAMKIESQLSKDQILEIYLNQIFMGQRAYGFTAAAEAYFGKSIEDLTIAEAAMLAGIPKAPSAFNPIVNPSRAKLRQQYIIDRMAEIGAITEAQKEGAKAQTLKYRVKTEVPAYADFVTEATRMLMFAQYGESAYTRGLNVYTAIRSQEQATAYRALRRGLVAYDKRHGYRGPEAFIDLPDTAKPNDPSLIEAFQDHPDDDEYKTAIVLEADTRKVTAVRQNGEVLTLTGEALTFAASQLLPKANPKTRIRRGAVLRVIDDNGKGRWAITQMPEVEGALVAMDPHTGYIRTMIGGFDYSRSKFNHVTQAWRQPGSSFKPFVYSAALEKGLTPATVINDAPLFFDASVTGSLPWEPKNYDGTFDGPMSLRRGLAKSKNMVSIRVLEKISPEFAQSWASRFGFLPERNPAYLTMALGAGSTTPMQLTQAYAVFANGGYLIPPVLITKVTDSRGKILTENTPRRPAEFQRVIEERNAFVMGRLLQEVTRSGTARQAQQTLKRADIYGKTGTTNDSLDSWFAGYQPNLVSVVWIGYDVPRKLGDKETGGSLALPVWIDYMSHALKSEPVVEAYPPTGVVNEAGEWYFEEYAGGRGVPSLGLEDQLPSAPADASREERKGILDLFNQGQ